MGSPVRGLATGCATPTTHGVDRWTGTQRRLPRDGPPLLLLRIEYGGAAGHSGHDTGRYHVPRNNTNTHVCYGQDGRAAWALSWGKGRCRGARKGRDDRRNILCWRAGISTTPGRVSCYDMSAYGMYDGWYRRGVLYRVKGHLQSSSSRNGSQDTCSFFF